MYVWSNGPTEFLSNDDGSLLAHTTPHPGRRQARQRVPAPQQGGVRKEMQASDTGGGSRFHQSLVKLRRKERRRRHQLRGMVAGRDGREGRESPMAMSMTYS